MDCYPTLRYCGLYLCFVLFDDCVFACSRLFSLGLLLEHAMWPKDKPATNQPTMPASRLSLTLQPLSVRACRLHLITLTLDGVFCQCSSLLLCSSCLCAWSWTSSRRFSRRSLRPPSEDPQASSSLACRQTFGSPRVLARHVSRSRARATCA